MCGIAGIVGEGAIRHIDALKRMIAAQAHRGPDGEGIYSSPSGLCVMGHRRLAIVDLSDAAAQPMLTTDSRFALVYNGMCYNFPELKEELTRRGEPFKSRSDTEVILSLLARDGARALERLNAMFALALWDESKLELLLARDRFGQKPLYIARSGKLVIFASEIRALLESGLIPRRADTKGICGYLSYGALQKPDTIVEGVSVLSRASYATIGPDGQENSEVYWSPELDKQEYTPQELREIFKKAVARHLISDVPVGLFLSGGVDSSSIAAAAVRSSKDRVKTLTVVFPEQPEESEADHARRMADYAQTEHSEVPIAGEDILRLMPMALDAMDQPTVDGINTFVISHAVRQAGLKVALSGLGGDELFGGYPSFRDVPRMIRLRRLLGPLSAPAADLLGDPGLFARKAAKLADMLDAPGDVLSSYLVRRRLFSSRQIKDLMPALKQEAWISGLAPERLREIQTMVKDREILDAVGLLEMDVYMGQMLLRDSDFMSMAHGLELRVPFLDAQFADCTLALEPAARMPRKIPKLRFVQAMGDWLPEENTRRPKRGFGMPFHEWMLKELRDEVEEGINALASVGGPVDGDAVRRVWKTFSSEPRKLHWSRPWSLFALGRYLASQRLSM